MHLIGQFISDATIRTDFRLKKVDNDPLKLCLATHADRYMAAEVPESEVRTFANRNNMNLFRTSNINENVRSNNTIDGASSIKEICSNLRTVTVRQSETVTFCIKL